MPDTGASPSGMTTAREDPDTTDLFAVVKFDNPLAVTGATDRPLTDSARVWIDTAGTEEDGA